MKITDIKAREILDSRGNPTVEVDIVEDTLFQVVLLLEVEKLWN